jgi:hypothetical protein
LDVGEPSNATDLNGDYFLGGLATVLQIRRQQTGWSLSTPAELAVLV